MNVLVTGANGQLGKSLNDYVMNNYSIHEFVFAPKEHLDLCDFKEVRNYIEKKNFDLVINCAAYTSVDSAEIETKVANLINHLSVNNLAEIARDNNMKLIHISTDYVFDGLKVESYDETDFTNPLNIYGKSKLDSENAIFNVMNVNAIIIRTSWVYSIYGNNFVDTILKLCKSRNELNVVSDQIGSPTFAKDLSSALINIIENKKFIKSNQASQIFHYSNDGKCSWYEFAKEINSLAGTKCKINPIFSKDYPQEAIRPKHVLMNKRKIVDFFDLEIINWKQSLRECIQVLSSNSKNTSQ